MNGSRGIRPYIWLLLFSALIAIVLSGGNALAADRMPVYVDEYGIRVCGEPGEDPHLRIKEDFAFNQDCSTVTLSECRDGPAPLVPYGDGTLGGSARPVPGIRVLLWMIIDSLQR